MKKLLRNRLSTILLWGFALIGVFTLASQGIQYVDAAQAQSGMRSAEELNNGLFVSLSTDDIDRAAMAINFATNVRKETGRPATIFLNVEGVRLADTNIPSNIHVSGKAVPEMLQSFMDAGGVVLVCPMCMKNVGGMVEDDIIAGAIVSSPEVVWAALFADNVTVLSY